MPASPVKWSAFAGPEVEQVFGLPYGTKRKTDDEAANLNECTTDGIQLPRKRFCEWQQQTPVPRHQNGGILGQEILAGALSAGCNDMEMEETQAYHNQSQNNNVVQAEATQHHSENTAQDDDLNSNMLMNINDDDGCCGMDDYASAYEAMDGEGAVNYSQYGNISLPAESTAGVTYQHEAYCFGAEASPNSGSVKCYCRPSWETMLDNKAYNSDVY